MSAPLLATIQRNPMLAALAAATTVYSVAMLMLAPAREASAPSISESTPLVQICEYLPTGDIANCVIQN